MIENLEGIKEIVNFMEETHLRLYHNIGIESYPAHWHRPVELIMPLEGDYEAIINNTTYHLHPNEILLICPGVLHILNATSHGERIIFQADLSAVDSIYGLNSILSFLNPCVVFTPENAPAIHGDLVAILESIRSEYFASTDLNDEGSVRLHASGKVSENNLCELSIYSKLMQMLTLIGRHYISKLPTESHNRTKQQEYINKFMSICAYIDSHFSEDLTLEEIAEMSNFSKYHFSRLFHEFTNMSFYKYVNRKRISCAESLLTNPNISTTEVAIQSGFSSQSAFIRMFKQFNNCTPSEFRKMQQMHEFSAKAPN